MGWIKLHRDILKNPTIMKDTDYMATWIYLLLNARYEPTDINFKGERITLSPGEFSTGRKRIAEDLGISESKVQRILKTFENEHQIEQRTDRQCRVISIVKWDEYQVSEQRLEQRVNNDRTTSEQRVNTNKEIKNINNKKNHSSSREEGRPVRSEWGKLSTEQRREELAHRSAIALAEVEREFRNFNRK